MEGLEVGMGENVVGTAKKCSEREAADDAADELAIRLRVMWRLIRCLNYMASWIDRPSSMAVNGRLIVHLVLGKRRPSSFVPVFKKETPSNVSPVNALWDECGKTIC